MAGPQGVGLGGNQPQIIELPGMGNVGNVGGVQPGGVRPNAVQQPGAPQEPAFREPSRAADVVGQLDVLLLKAVKGSTGEVTEVAVEKAAKSAKLPKEMTTHLKELAGKAQECLAALDQFTGKDLAAAMEKKAGTVGWKEDSKAAMAFAAAQEAQEALSSALAEALARAKNGKTQATLEELMLQCDRRIGEIETLVLQMTEIIDAGGENAEDNAAALADGRPLSSFTSAEALDKFGRAEMLTALKSDLKPLTDRLAAYEQDGSQALKKADIDACVRELNAVKARFSAAAASGELKVGERNVAVDRSLLSEASKLLDGVGRKINAIHREVLRAAMVDFVEKEIPFINEKIFSPQFAGELHKLKGMVENNNQQPDNQKPPAQELEDFAIQLNVFRSAARAYVQSPTKENELKLKDAAETLAYMPTEQAKECMSFTAITSFKTTADASPEFKEAFKEFQLQTANDPSSKAAIPKLIDSMYDSIEIAAQKLINFGKEFNAGKSGKYFVSGAVLDVFQGEMSLSPLLESRVHGYADSDVNTALDDKNVTDSRTLGAGNFNTVTLVKVKDGSEWVFKPELPGRLTAPRSSLNEGLDVNQEMTRINLAVQETADTLGLGDVMVKTSAGTHKGQFGMFMEKAPGITGKAFKGTEKPLASQGKLGPVEIKQLGDAEFGKVVGRMMRKLNRMQWFDTITAQGDRHADNFMIDIDRTDLTVTVKAIDNDACYGIFRQGLYKFSIQPGTGMEELFDQALNDLASGIKDKDTIETLKENIFDDSGVTRKKNGTIEIDLSKSENPLLLTGLLKATGMKNIAPPGEIDRDLYDKLMLLAKDAPDGGAARKKHLTSLAERLGKNSAQYKAAVQRLDESIAHARKLNAEGKVYTPEQWEDHDVQRQVAAPNLQNMQKGIGTYNIIRKDVAEDCSRNGRYANYTNTFFRDFFGTLVQNSNRSDWFNG